MVRVSPAQAKARAKKIRAQIANLRKDRAQELRALDAACKAAAGTAKGALVRLREASRELVKARKAELAARRAEACGPSQEAKRAKKKAENAAVKALAEAEKAAAVLEAAKPTPPERDAQVEAILVEMDAPALIPAWREVGDAIEAPTAEKAVEVLLAYAQQAPEEIAAAIDRQGEELAAELEAGLEEAPPVTPEDPSSFEEPKRESPLPALEGVATPALDRLGIAVAPLPQRTVLDAYRASSWDPDRRAAEDQRSFLAKIEAVAEEAERRHPERARSLVEAFERGYRTHMLAVLGARSRTASAAVVGPSKFPTERNRKALEVERKRFGELMDFEKKFLASMRHQSRAISSDQGDAIQQLRAKLEDVETRDRNLDQLKAVASNKKLPVEEKERMLLELGLSKHAAEMGARRGWAAISYSRQNLRQEKKRIEDRIATLEKESARSEVEVEVELPDGNALRVLDSPEKNRIQLFFTDRISSELAATLKGRGFRWAPSEKAWQRQRTDNARWAVKALFGVDLMNPQAPPAPAAPAEPTAEQIQDALRAVRAATAGREVEHAQLHSVADPAASHEATDAAIEVLQERGDLERVEREGMLFYRGRREAPPPPLPAPPPPVFRAAEGFRPAQAPGQVGALFEDVEPAPLPVDLEAMGIPVRWLGDVLAGYSVAPEMVDAALGVVPVPLGSEAAAYFPASSDDFDVKEARAEGLALIQIAEGIFEAREKSDAEALVDASVDHAAGRDEAPRPELDVWPIFYEFPAVRGRDHEGFARGAIRAAGILGKDRVNDLAARGIYFALSGETQHDATAETWGQLDAREGSLVSVYGLEPIALDTTVKRVERERWEREEAVRKESDQRMDALYQDVLTAPAPVPAPAPAPVPETEPARAPSPFWTMEQPRVPSFRRARWGEFVTSGPGVAVDVAEPSAEIKLLTLRTAERTIRITMDRRLDDLLRPILHALILTADANQAELKRDPLFFTQLAMGSVNEWIATTERKALRFVDVRRPTQKDTDVSISPVDLIRRDGVVGLAKEGRGHYQVLYLPQGASVLRGMMVPEATAKEIYRLWVQSRRLSSENVIEDWSDRLGRGVMRHVAQIGELERQYQAKKRTSNPDAGPLPERCKATREEIRALESDQRALVARLLEIKRQEIVEARVSACDAPKKAIRDRYDAQIDALIREASALEAQARGFTAREKDRQRQKLPELTRASSDALIGATLGGFAPELLPHWEQLRGTIDGPTALARLEVFLKFVQDNPQELQEAPVPPPAPPKAPRAPRAPKAPPSRPPLTPARILEVARTVTPISTDLVNVAPVMRVLLAEGYPLGEVQAAVLLADREKLLELTADTGVGKFSREDLAILPPGPRGMFLAHAHILQGPSPAPAAPPPPPVSPSPLPESPAKTVPGDPQIFRIEGGARIAVWSPYEPGWIAAAKRMGGRFGTTEVSRTDGSRIGLKVWTFDARDEARVREALIAEYGTDGTPTPRVDMVVRPAAFEAGRELFLWGRQILSRLSRDTSVKLGDGVSILKGRFPSSGGSMKYPKIEAPSDVLILVRDVPRAIVSEEYLSGADKDAYPQASERTPNPSGGAWRVWREDGRVKAAGPFSLAFQRGALELGGRWNRTGGYWFFDPGLEAEVRVLSGRTENPGCGCPHAT